MSLACGITNTWVGREEFGQITNLFFLLFLNINASIVVFCVSLIMILLLLTFSVK